MKDDDDQQRAALRPSHHHDDEAFATVALRWSLAGLCVFALYGGGVYAAMSWLAPATAAVELPAAIMIEMSPVAEAPETSQQDVALGPTMEMSQAATPAEQQDKPEEPQPDVQPETKTEVELPPLPEKKTEAVLAQPPPSDPAQQTSKQQRKPERPKTAKSRPDTRAARNAPATAAPQAADARRASVNAAPMAGTSSSVSPANWRSMVMALLNRHKRLPPGGSRGTATVAFTIDRSGHVGSARLVGSSGDPILDQEAVALARRASPLPPPPADFAGGSILLSVPVRFGD
ncbi:TonB family protein [Bradyrhizobium sp. 5.13L]